MYRAVDDVFLAGSNAPPHPETMPTDRTVLDGFPQITQLLMPSKPFHMAAGSLHPERYRSEHEHAPPSGTHESSATRFPARYST